MSGCDFHIYNLIAAETMAKQLSFVEWEQVRRSAGTRATAVEIWEKLKAARAKRSLPPPDLTTIRRFLKGKTHRLEARENCGRVPDLHTAERVEDGENTHRADC